MMCSILFIELTMSLEKDSYKEFLDTAGDRAMKKGYQIHETDFGYLDESLTDKGIAIAFCGGKKKKIKIIVYPGLIVDDDQGELWKPTNDNASRLTGKLDKHLRKYFINYGLDDFNLSRVDFAADLDVGSRDKAADYIRVLHHGLGRVKCFYPIKHDKDKGIIDKDVCFGLEGNSKAVEFWVYGLKYDKKTLRVEVQLTKADSIRAYSDESDTSDLIRVLANSSDHIFMDTFRYIVPPGDYFKKPKAEKLIRERVSDVAMRRRMLRLMALIKEQKSLHLGVKALNFREFRDVLQAFAEINISPVTISSRHDVKRLDGLYRYM